MLLKKHLVVGDEYIGEAPTRVVATAALPCDSGSLFRILVAPRPWTEWLGLRGVTYTSPEPYGVGTTRTVEIAGQRIDERFFSYEPGSRLAFFAEASTLPFAAFVEDFAIRGRGVQACELRWTTALTARPRIAGAFLAPAIKANCNRGLSKLKGFVREHAAEYASDEPAPD